MLPAGIASALLAASIIAPTAAGASTSSSSTFVGGLHKLATVAPTTPANGDINPYSVFVAPVTSGTIHQGDVLVDNFNAKSNEQGTGSTIMDITPSGTAKLFATVPSHLAGCPGGVGLTTAFTMLAPGVILVGSAPSSDGTSKTAGAGCLIALNTAGKVLSTITGSNIDGPWDMASVDNGSTATLYVANTLFGVKAPGQATLDRGELVRIALKLSGATAPVVTSTTVIASGLSEQASASAFVLGPAGVALIGTTAYVTDPVDSSILAVKNATTRTSSAGRGTTLTSAGLLHHPIAMVAAPNGHLLVTNGLNGDVVEVSTSGQQLKQLAIDPDPAQSPPGSGDLFGLAVAPSGKGLYFAKDDTNTLALLS